MLVVLTSFIMHQLTLCHHLYFSSHQPQEKELTAPNTSADQGETNQQRNGLPTAALVGGGLAGIGAGTAYNARSGAGENR